MAGNRGNLLPVYIVADESYSMKPVIGELNSGLASLHEALLGEPMAAAKVRFSILGFSDTVEVRMRLVDLRRETNLPLLIPRGSTDYAAAFDDLRQRIPVDVATLNTEGYTVHRPAVFFLSDGQPNVSDGQPNGGGWRESHRQLVDRSITRGAPNIIACGIGEAEASTILSVATQPEYGWVALSNVDLGADIARFCTALTKSIVESGRSLGSAQPELIVEPPTGFRMAIDVV